MDEVSNAVFTFTRLYVLHDLGIDRTSFIPEIFAVDTNPLLIPCPPNLFVPSIKVCGHYGHPVRNRLVRLSLSGSTTDVP